MLHSSNSLGNEVRAVRNVALEAEQPSYKGMQMDEVYVSIQCSKLWPSLCGQLPCGRMIPAWLHITLITLFL